MNLLHPPFVHFVVALPVVALFSQFTYIVTKDKSYSKAALRIIAFSFLTSIFAVFGVSGTALVVSGHQKLNLVNALSATILNIFLNIILIPTYGILGAALATLSSMTFIALARLIETWIFLKISPFNFKLFK